MKLVLVLLAVFGCSEPPPPERTARSEVCQVLTRSTAFPMRVVGYRGLRAQCCAQGVRASCGEVQRALREHSDPAAAEGFLGPDISWSWDCKHPIGKDDVEAFLMDDRMAPWESVRARMRGYVQGPHGLVDPDILLLEASRPNPEGSEALALELMTLSDRDLRRLEPMLSHPDPLARFLAAKAFSYAALFARLELGGTEAALARLAHEPHDGDPAGPAAKAREESRLTLFSQKVWKTQTPEQAVKRFASNWAMLGRRRATCGATNLDWALGKLRASRGRTPADQLADPFIARVLEERRQLCPEEDASTMTAPHHTSD